MDGQAQLATRSVTNTNMMVATAILLAAGGFAYMAGVGSLPQGSGSGNSGGYGYGYNADKYACGVGRVEPQNACGKTYRNSVAVCYSGKKNTVPECLSGTDAALQAKQPCANECKGGKCGVQKYSLGQSCGQTYTSAQARCSDGYEVYVNFPGQCLTKTQLTVLAKKVCQTRSCAPVAIIPSGNIVFTKSASSSLAKLVAVGGSEGASEVPMLSVDAMATGEDAQITKFVAIYTGAPSNDEHAAFGQLKLYRVDAMGERQIGSYVYLGPWSGSYQYAATFDIQHGQLRIAKDTKTTLVVRANFNGTQNGTISGMSPLLQFGDGRSADTDVVNVRGDSSGVAYQPDKINGADTLNLSGEQVVLYRSYPTVSAVALPGSVLVNGVEQDIFKFSASANPEGNVALKQLRFIIDVKDNVGTRNSLSVSGFKLYRGQTDISDQVLFHSDYGGTGLWVGVETAKRFFITWKGTNEQIIPAGSASLFTIKATLNGFTTDADDDYVRVRYVNDDAAIELPQNNPARYISPVGRDAREAIMGLATQAGALAPSAGTTFLWSDINAAGHSAATGTFSGIPVSTGDWFNGYLVKETASNMSFLLR